MDPKSYHLEILPESGYNHYSDWFSFANLKEALRVAYPYHKVKLYKGCELIGVSNEITA